LRLQTRCSFDFSINSNFFHLYPLKIVSLPISKTKNRSKPSGKCINGKTPLCYPSAATNPSFELGNQQFLLCARKVYSYIQYLRNSSNICQRVAKRTPLYKSLKAFYKIKEHLENVYQSKVLLPFFFSLLRGSL
jgi:hypothetical protein